MKLSFLNKEFFLFNTMSKVSGVYCIACNDPLITDFYIGFTTNFRRRILCHKHNTQNPNCGKYNLKLYKFIRENGGIDNWSFYMIEEGTDRAREKHFYEMLQPTLNIQHCGLTMREYRKKYYASEKGREITLANFRRKVECEHCGKVLSKSSVCLHKKKACPVLNPKKVRVPKVKKNDEPKIEVINKKVEIFF
jgi:hypothetical protein